MNLASALLILAGAALACTGSLGLLTLGSFFERVHAPTLGTTLGTGLVLAGSMLHIGSLHELVIGAFIFLSAPVTTMLLVRAALYRDARNADGRDARRG